jgi:hypothetical protein
MPEANSSTITAESDELGSYRSLSSLAVLSFVLGLLSMLSFAPSSFFVLTFPPLAIVFGLLAARQVRGAPEVYIGMRLAKLGVGIALLCAVGSVVVKYMNTSRIGNHGHIIADRFVGKLKAGDTEGAFWLKIPRESRAAYLTRGGNEVPDQMKQQYVSFYADAKPYSDSLSRGEATLEFDSIEQATVDRGTEYASVIYRYHSPKEDSHILVLAASYLGESRERSWYIKDFKPSYTPNSFTEPGGSSGHDHVH